MKLENKNAEMIIEIIMKELKQRHLLKIFNSF
jgi:hypothetical protein